MATPTPADGGRDALVAPAATTSRPIDLADITRSTNLDRSRVDDIPRTRLGLAVFRTVVGLVAGVGVALSIYAVVSYPSVADVRALLGPDATGAATLTAWREIRAEWVQQMRDIAQLALFGSLIPLLGTIIGYMLGRQDRGEG